MVIPDHVTQSVAGQLIVSPATAASARFTGLTAPLNARERNATTESHDETNRRVEIPIPRQITRRNFSLDQFTTYINPNLQAM
jgi:hypothetical protein